MEQLSAYLLSSKKLMVLIPVLGPLCFPSGLCPGFSVPPHNHVMSAGCDLVFTLPHHLGHVNTVSPQHGPICGPQTSCEVATSNTWTKNTLQRDEKNVCVFFFFFFTPLTLPTISLFKLYRGNSAEASQCKLVLRGCS